MKRLVFTLLAIVAGLGTLAFGLVDAWLALRGVYLFWTLHWLQLLALTGVATFVSGVTSVLAYATVMCVEVASGE